MSNDIHFFKERKFEKTEIGEVSDSWKVIKLKDAAEINKESRDPIKEIPNDKFIYIDINSIEGGSGNIVTPQVILGKNAPSRARRVVHERDVIMSTVRPYLKAFAIISKEYDNQICSTGFAVLSCKKEIMPQFLLHMLFSKIVIDQCNRMVVGGQYPALNQSQVSMIRLPLPPLVEQQKIASVFSTISEAIQRTNEIIRKTQELKKGLMQRLLTKGIGHTKFKKTEIGEIPEDWEILKLSDVILEAKPGFASGRREKNGIIQLRMNSIDAEGWINKDEYVKVPAPKNIEGYVLKYGDILFNNTNSADLIGKTAIFKEEIPRCVYSNHLTRIRVNPNKVIPEWILFNFVRNWQLGIFRAIRHQHVHQAGINKGDLLNVKVPVTSLDEQRRIVDILSTVAEKIEKERQTKEQFEKTKKWFMRNLLTGKIRIKVN